MIIDTKECQLKIMKQPTKRQDNLYGVEIERNKSNLKCK
jgi:hypothetical protein